MHEILLNEMKLIKKQETKDEVVYKILCAYYDAYIEKNANEESNLFPEELLLPLEQRTSGIVEVMEWLVKEGFDLNEGEGFNPLMMAVGHADAAMTSFLIQNGADANYWPDMEEIPESYRDNYYLEDIDIAYYNESWELTENYVMALLNTAKVLLEKGKTGSFYGLCLSADAEKREIQLRGAQYKY